MILLCPPAAAPQLNAYLDVTATQRCPVDKLISPTLFLSTVLVEVEDRKKEIMLFLIGTSIQPN